MSDMEETEGSEGPLAPRRVIGTPPPTPRLLGSTSVAEGGDAGQVSDDTGGGEHGDEVLLAAVPDQRAKRVEKIIAGCFTCGFIAAYVGLEVGSNRLGSGDSVIDAALRSNLALGTSLAVTLLALGLGALLWVRYLMPDVEVTEERHDLRSDPKDRQAFEQYFKEGASNSQFVKRPLV